MFYSVNTLQDFQRRNCSKEITENSQNIVRPHREVIISVAVRPVGQTSWICIPLEICKSTLSRLVAFQLSISFTVVFSNCKILRRTRRSVRQIAHGGQVQRPSEKASARRCAQSKEKNSNRDSHPEGSWKHSLITINSSFENRLSWSMRACKF